MPLITDITEFKRKTKHKNFDLFNLNADETISLINELNITKCEDCNAILFYENYKPLCLYQFSFCKRDRKQERSKNNMKICCYGCVMGDTIKLENNTYIKSKKCPNLCCDLTEEERKLLDEYEAREEAEYIKICDNERAIQLKKQEEFYTGNSEGENEDEYDYDDDALLKEELCEYFKNVNSDEEEDDNE